MQLLTIMNVPNRASAFLIVLFFALCFCVAVSLSSAWLRSVFAGYAAVGVRHEAVLRITASVVGELLTVGLVILYLRWQDHSLAEIGFGQPAPLRGWISAAIVTIAVTSLMLAGPLRGRAPLFELSWFHLYTSVAAGLAAGFCEEIVFRGFLMNQLAWAGAGRVPQVLTSALLFGLAHVGWTALGHGFNPRLFLGSVIPTAIFGALYAGIYLLSGRSLMPVIVAHALTDMVIEPWLLLAALSGALRQA